MNAPQYFTIEDPAFIWRVESTMFGFLPVTGRDRYQAGSGHMLIKVASLVNVADTADDKIAHGALLRFLGEIVWFPSAALSPYIHWQGVEIPVRGEVQWQLPNGVFTYYRWEILELEHNRAELYGARPAERASEQATVQRTPPASIPAPQ